MAAAAEEIRHEAFVVSEVFNWRKRAPFEITAVDHYGDDHLLLGGSNGSFLSYRIDERDKTRLHNEKFCANFVSKSSITGIQAIPELNLLLVLSGGIIHVRSLTSLHPPKTPTVPTKGCTLFRAELVCKNGSLVDFYSTRRPDIPADNLTIRLAAAVKDRVLVFNYANDEFILHKEMKFNSAIRCFAWSGKHIIVGLRERFAMVEVETRSVKSLFELSGKYDPVSRRLPANEILLCYELQGALKRGVFYNLNGHPARSDSIPWSKMPTDADGRGPFILGLMSDGVEVVLPPLPSSAQIKAEKSTAIVQFIPLEAPLFLTTSKYIYVASKRACWCISPVPLDQQVNALVHNKHFSYALDLAPFIEESHEELDSRIQEIKLSYALHLFQQKHFNDSLTNFLQVNADPQRVMGMYPWLLKDFFDTSQFQPYGDVPDLTEDEKRRATEALTTYLTETRNKLLSQQQHASDAEKEHIELLREAVDSMFLICYLTVDKRRVTHFVGIQGNRANVELCDALLRAHKRYKDLVKFYDKRGLHKKALDLLFEMAKTSPNPSAEYQAIIDYLTRLGKQETPLVLEYCRILLAKGIDKDKVIDIFTQDDDPEKRLDERAVLDFLRTTDAGSVTAYLEHVINQQNSESEEFHTELALMYLSQLEKLIDRTHKPGTPLPQEGSSELAAVRQKFREFLRSSKFYRPNELQSHLSHVTPLYEERALLLGRLGRHKQALSILVYDLGKPESAEEHCALYYRPDKEHDSGVYADLMKIYLRPPEPHKPRIQAALSLLSRHHDKINAADVLKMLPESTPVHALRGFLANVLEAKAAERRRTTVVKNLLKAENLQSHDELYNHQARRIYIDHNTKCVVCHSEIRTSTFAYFPAGVITHFNCMKDRKTCPLAAKDCACPLKHDH